MTATYRTWLVLAALFFALGANAQDKSKAEQKADELWAIEQYGQAADFYKRAYAGIKDQTHKAEVAYRVAECYRLKRSFNQAEGWYEKAIDNGYADQNVHLMRAQMLLSIEDYEAALQEFNTFASANPANEFVKEQIDMTKNAMEWVQNPPSRFIIQPFKLANSNMNDFGPVLQKKTLYFTSDRPEANGKGQYGRISGDNQKVGYTDIFVMNRKKTGKTERWDPALALEGGVNGNYNDGMLTFDDRGNVMIFTQCSGYEGRSNNCVLMTSKRQGSGWSQGTIIAEICTDTTVDYGQPTLSSDGNTMIFVMNSKEKGSDLYITTYDKRARKWNTPEKLPDNINTEGEEMFPSFFNDTTLYFSSDRLPGIGGLDLFVTYGTFPNYSKPQNLTYPLNSGGDDFGIAFEEDRKSGYFSSNRRGSNNDDIYTFNLDPCENTLKGVVTDSKTGRVVPNATVVINGDQPNTKKEVKTDNEGKYSVQLNRETKYDIMAKKDRYFSSESAEQSTKGIEYWVCRDLVQDLVITPQNVQLELKGILYGLDSFNLRPESKNTLDSLIGILNDYPYIVVELQAHTDCRAPYAYNMTLSQNRAQSVVDYLVAAGIAGDRLVPKGYGESVLKTPCPCEKDDDPTNDAGDNCTEEQHQANRRTELKVIAWDYKPK